MLQALVPTLPLHTHPAAGRPESRAPPVAGSPAEARQRRQAPHVDRPGHTAGDPPRGPNRTRSAADARARGSGASAAPTPAPSRRGGAGPGRSTTCRDVPPGAAAPATSPSIARGSADGVSRSTVIGSQSATSPRTAGTSAAACSAAPFAGLVNTDKRTSSPAAVAGHAPESATP